MALDASIIPITNTTTQQFEGLTKKLDGQLETARSQVKSLEELVSKYNNKATKNKEAVLAQINKLKSSISKTVSSTVADASEMAADLQAAVATIKTETDTMYSMVSPLMTMPSFSPDSLSQLTKYIQALVNVAKTIGTSLLSKQADVTAAATACAVGFSKVTSQCSELKGLADKAKSLTSKFN